MAERKVVCLQVANAEETVKNYQDMGCTVKRHSKRGTFLDCQNSPAYNQQDFINEIDVNEIAWYQPPE